jgi:hypothetical protein
MHMSNRRKIGKQCQALFVVVVWFPLVGAVTAGAEDDVRNLALNRAAYTPP